MSTRSIIYSFGLTLLVFCLVPGQTKAAAFQGLGYVPSGGTFSRVIAVSGDGTTLVGQTSNSSSSNPAFIWTAVGGLKPLYNANVTGLGNKISANGQIVAGEDDGSGARAIRYNVGGALTYLGGLNPNGSPPNQGRSYSLSRDGLVVVGSVASPASTGGEQAFRYTGAGGLVALGFLGSPNGISYYSEAHDISGDGGVTVGFSSSSAGQDAFRYTVAGGMVDLGRFAGDTDSRYFANAVSTNGNVIVGAAVGNRAFTWTQATGLLGLTSLSGAANALDVNADGSVIVGADKLGTDLNTHAVFWQNGVEFNLKTFLLNQGNTAVSTWDLRTATGISEDRGCVKMLGFPTPDW